ncbi:MULTISPECIES: hypothetical protein [Enterobacterales]
MVAQTLTRSTISNSNVNPSYCAGGHTFRKVAADWHYTECM